MRTFFIWRRRELFGVGKEVSAPKRRNGGAKSVVHTLQRAIELERIHHAFLFTGYEGRQTTIARLMAKCLSCETGITANPCGECAACVGISDGTWVDVREIDGASNTGVDDVRVLRESDSICRRRQGLSTFIIDAVHMLSTNAFNALLQRKNRLHTLSLCLRRRSHTKSQSPFSALPTL